ncbi:hypothetical protein CYMTET_31331, partial [Cymbomonas tetramitiformis]
GWLRAEPAESAGAVAPGLWLARRGCGSALVKLEGRVAASRLGTYYEARPDGGRSLFNGKSADLTMCRVYVGLEETEKAKEYEPNMLQWQPGELEKIRESDKE